MKTNIFVIGLDDFHRKILNTVRNADSCSFHNLLVYDQIIHPKHYAIEEMIEYGSRQLEDFDGNVDAIIGHWDFPIPLMLAVFRKQLGLGGPTLPNILVSEHKYWYRLRQKQVVPECTPRFEPVNPFDKNAANKIKLAYPFWLKPVIAFSSQMAFFIGNRQQLDKALHLTREGIGLFGEPFRAFTRRCELPPDIPSNIDAFWCIAEEPIDGEQCTTEGYIRNGKAHVYGVVDSFREGRYNSSFSRYQLPSRLPQGVQERMIDAAKRTIPALGLDNTPFNIEFYWDKNNDCIWQLEVNARLSKSHCPLFVDVYGSSHHQVAIDIALGREPEYSSQMGQHTIAAKFMLRRHRNARVTRVPTEDELKQLETRYPGTMIQIAVEEGMLLSELLGQDPYSFEIAVVFMGASDPESLEAHFEQLKRELPLEFDEGAAA